jgi:hypothetical protein
MSFLERWSSVRCACFAWLLLAGVEPGKSSSQDTHKPAPKRFEHYELVTGEDEKPLELGRGAMGVTYKAFDINLHCPVTLKVISERYLGDESARLRFLREARAAASVRHPNVVQVDIRSDLYSLGVTLWVMLTGNSPFRGPFAEVMYQHQHAHLPLERLKDVAQPS